MGQAGITIVSENRLTKLETEVEHVQKDVGEIKGELSGIRMINSNVEKSLSRLTAISEQNQKLDGKLDTLNARITANEKFIWKASGAVAVIAILAPIALNYFVKL